MDVYQTLEWIPLSKKILKLWIWLEGGQPQESCSVAAL